MRAPRRDALHASDRQARRDDVLQLGLLVRQLEAKRAAVGAGPEVDARDAVVAAAARNEPVALEALRDFPGEDEQVTVRHEALLLAPWRAG